MSAVIAMSGSIKKYINRFIEANAISPENAKTPVELGCKRSAVINQLVLKGVLIHVGEDKYYLNEDALENFVSNERKVGFITTSVIMVLILIVLAYYLK